MPTQHPLLKRAQKYRRKQHDLTPTGCIYDHTIGAWKIENTGELWVETPGRIGPSTKKNDVETGEDQKGE